MNKKRTFTAWFNSLFPNCQETTLYVVKEQEGALNPGERLKMWFHVYLVCKFCRLFRQQSSSLHHHVHHAAKRSTLENSVFVLSEQQKREIEDAINRQLSGI